MVDRNKQAKDDLKNRKDRRKLDEMTMKHLRAAQEKMDYIKNLINGRYFLARCNMMAEQLVSKKILEKVDGAPKTEEYLRAEYALTKRQAMDSMRYAHFGRKDLKEKFGFTDDEILDLETDYYDGKIVRDNYDELERKQTRAEFVKHNAVKPEDT